MPQPPSLISPCEAALSPRLEQRIVVGLERIAAAVAELGHPERQFPSVLVLGTNGKGSTASLLASVLSHHGLRVGLYTSPHLVRVEERIRVDGTTIAPGRLLQLVDLLGRFPELSYFETLTAAAFLHFAEERVGIAILEAGLGGRWDATNVVDPTVTLLTNVGTDHREWLGATRTEIAAEKGAAIRGCEGVIGAWDDEVEPVIRVTADAATPLSLASEWASVSVARGPRRVARRDEVARPTVAFSVVGCSGRARLPLLGAHQVANLTVALAGAAALAKHGVVAELQGDAIAAGIEATIWPGRLQWVGWNGHRLLLDGAHNRESVLALANALDELGLGGKVNLLFSCLADKPLADMAAALRPRVAEVAVVPLDSPRAMPTAELAAAFQGAAAHNAVSDALASLPPDRPVLVAGSLRLVGEVMAVLEGRQRE